MEKTEVLMIGCGNMGGALLARWLEQPGYRFTVVSPSGRPMPNGVDVVRGADAVSGRTFDLVVLAVKPQLIDDIAPDYKDSIGEHGGFLSIAAGYSSASLEALLGQRPLLRVMPNMPVRIGRGVSALFANRHAGPEHRAAAERLMAATGELFWVDSEDQLDRVTAMAGSGPGYVFEIARCWAQAGQALGFPDEVARTMVLQTLAGAVELALDSDASLDELRDGVTSRNGTTEAGLSTLNGDAGLDHRLRRTVEAAYARAVELR